MPAGLESATGRATEWSIRSRPFESDRRLHSSSLIARGRAESCCVHVRRAGFFVAWRLSPPEGEVSPDALAAAPRRVPGGLVCCVGGGRCRVEWSAEKGGGDCPVRWTRPRSHRPFAAGSGRQACARLPSRTAGGRPLRRLWQSVWQSSAFRYGSRRFSPLESVSRASFAPRLGFGGRRSIQLSYWATGDTS